MCAAVAKGQAIKQDDLKQRLAESGKAVGEKLYQELRKAVKDQEGKIQPVLDANSAKPGAMTDAEKTKIRGLLAKAWSDALDAPIKATLSQIDTERLKTLDALQADSSKVGAVNEAFRGVRGTLEQQLQGLRAEDKVKARLDSWDPSGAEAKSKALEILEKLSADLSTVFGTEWGRGEAKVVAGLAGRSPGQQLADVQGQINKINADNELGYYQELEKKTGFSRVVRCAWGDDPPLLTCKPGLQISAAEVGEIIISNLPVDQDVVVTALTADEISTTATDIFSRDKKAIETWNLQIGKALESDATTCLRSGDWERQLACDEIKFEKGEGGTVVIGVYKGRRVHPIYGGAFASSERAYEALRTGTGSRKGLSLLASGSVSQILVRVRVGDTLATTTINVGYERWGFETGGFFAVTKLTDERLIQQNNTDPNAPANEKVVVLKVTDAEHYSQETGIFLNFIPRNYPSLGLGLGFSSNSGRPLSAYLGPSLRLRSFGQRGIANFSAGFAMRSVKRFPNIDSGSKVPEGSPLLTGQDEYHVAPYALIQIGFSFGPIPGPEGNGTTTTTNNNP